MVVRGLNGLGAAASRITAAGAAPSEGVPASTGRSMVVVTGTSTSGWAGDVYAQYDEILEWIDGNDFLINDNELQKAAYNDFSGSLDSGSSVDFSSSPSLADNSCNCNHLYYSDYQTELKDQEYLQLVGVNEYDIVIDQTVFIA